MQTADKTETSQVPNENTLSLDSLSKTVGQLQEELKKSQAEKQKAVEKLDSLLFLIKQSWNGDSSATVNLSRIVGLQLEDETNGLTEKSKRAEDNWLQLTVGLLDEERKQDMLRMHQHQMSHIEQRYRYMEHVLHDHHRQMARFTRHIEGDPSLNYHGNSNHLPQSSRAKRKHSLNTRRIKSATTTTTTTTSTRKTSSPSEVDISKLCFKDLLIQPAPAVPRVTITPQKNNSSYLKRPVSAFIPKKQPIRNVCRPKTAAVTGLNRRKKKPNSNSTMSAKETTRSISLPSYTPETEFNEPYMLTDLWMEENQVKLKSYNVSFPQRTLTKNRVTFSPQTVQVCEAAEIKKPQSAKNNNLKKSNLQLQIRLGIPEESRVY